MHSPPATTGSSIMQLRDLSAVLLFAGGVALPAPTSSAQSQCSALSFSGQGDHVSVPFSSTFPRANFTAAAWIKAGIPSRRAAIISHGEDNMTGNSSWTLALQTDGTFQVMIEDIQDNNFWYSSSTNVADGRWHHVAATRTAEGAMALYVDGQVKATMQSAAPSPNNNQILTIGCTYGILGPPPPPPRPAWFFPGDLVEPAMWDRPLAPSEVAAVYAGGVDPGSPGLVGYWDFDEGSGQTVNDQSPAQNHGFLGPTSTADSADPQWLSHPGPSYVTFGQGCAGGAGIPTLALAPGQLPSIGASFDVVLSNLPASGPVFGLLGNSRTSWPPLTLPFDLTGIQMTGCTLYTNIVVAVPLSNIGGSATWTLAVPNHPGLLGLALYQQAFVADSGANPFGATTTNAGEALLGCQ